MIKKLRKMPKIIKLPKIGVNMTEALIMEWVVKEGESIKEGDLILVAETDKTTQDIFATESGIINKILVQAGENVSCQQPIAILIEPEEKSDKIFEPIDTGATKRENEKIVQPLLDEQSSVGETETIISSNQTERIKVSPLAKKTAKDNGIDYKQVLPSKPHGRIVQKDVLAFIENTKASLKISNTASLENEAIDIIPLTGIRKIIADRLTESNITKPSVSLTLHADAGQIIEWRNRLKENGKVVSYNDLLVAIIAKALKEHPIINSKMTDEGIHLLKDINIGIAVDSDKGLIVPVIRNADSKGVLEINEELINKIERAKSGNSSMEDLSDGTFTITNLGMFEIEHFTPIINPPECCILGVGAIIRVPVVVDDSDKIEIRSRVQLTLVFDHRIVDGAQAARFLQRIKQLVEWPMDLIS